MQEAHSSIGEPERMNRTASLSLVMSRRRSNRAVSAVVGTAMDNNTAPSVTRLILAICLTGLLAAGNGMAQTEPIPPGAALLGYTQRLIDEQPKASDIANDRSGPYKWFRGSWYSKNPPAANRFETRGGAMVVLLGGVLVSAPHDFSPGQLPLLPGANGFYVEVEARLSDNDPDHWPAIFLMPAEHNGKTQDHYPGDPPGFERWMELDIDEGGFGPGLMGAVHSWTGIYPKYRDIFNRGNNISRLPLDRTQWHTFGVSFDPSRQKVIWFVDGTEQMSAGAPYVPSVAAMQNFYLILGAGSHGANKPYSMFVRAVRAFIPPH
jgi:hypothetical protein